MIFVEPRQPNLTIVTRGEDAIGVDQNTPQGHLEVQLVVQKKAPLDVQQEKEVFLEDRKDFINTNQPSKSRQVRAMPKRFEQLIRRPPTKKVSKLKDFFKKKLALIHEKNVVA